MKVQQFPTTFLQHGINKKPLNRKWLSVRGRPEARCCRAAHVRSGQYQSCSHAHSIKMKTKREKDEQLSFSGSQVYNISSCDFNLPKSTIYASSSPS